jgi:hypothetical protein
MNGNIVGCKISRITVPLDTVAGDTVCAASFVYGVYVDNPADQDAFLNSHELESKFGKLPEEERWQYPEYVVIKHFQAWKTDNKEQLLSCYAAGYDREKKAASYKPMSEQEKVLSEELKRIVFFSKSFFGKYVRIYWLASGVTEAGSTKGCKGLAGSCYLKRVGDKYMITRKISNSNLFDAIVSTYDSQTIMKRESVELSPNVNNMNWFAIDCDMNSPADDRNYLKIFSSEGVWQKPESFSENYLKIYVKAKAVNLQIEAGKIAKGLSDKMRFFEDAVTAHQQADEEQILSMCSDRMKERLSRKIQQAKDFNAWPGRNVLPFSSSPTVLCSLNTSKGTILYYSPMQITPPAWVTKAAVPAKKPTYTIGIKKQDGYKLSNVTSNIFNNSMFIDSLVSLYSQ